MGSTQRPLQLFDPFLLLDIGLRGCASPPKRSLGSRLHFILPAVIEIGSDLILAARLGHVPALQTFQHNLPLLFRGSLDSRLSRHSRLLAEAPSLTNFRVQFYWGALQNDLTEPSSSSRKILTFFRQLIAEAISTSKFLQIEKTYQELRSSLDACSTLPDN